MSYIFTEGKINPYGTLFLKRGSAFAVAECPFRRSYRESDTQEPDEMLEYSQKSCGDWCPLFGEPTVHSTSKRQTLTICQGRELTFNSFTDMRE